MDLPAPTSDDDTLQLRATVRSQEPSLIRAFGIKGLYGYKNISLESDFAATILIARNGSGKTTLLGALDAFLQLQLSRLATIEFDEIYCELRDVPELLVLSSADIAEITRFEPTSSIVRLAQSMDATPAQAFDFIMSDFRQKILEAIDTGQEGIAYNLWRKSSYDMSRAIKRCEETYDDVLERTPRILNLRRILKRVLDGYEIVYLPTYRRVELALKEDKKRPHSRRGKNRFNIAPAGLHTGDIQFGLLDISERLEKINQELIFASNSGYREISGNIINELINGYPVDENAPLPEQADLELFFSRLESGSRRFGPVYPIHAPDIARIYHAERVTPDSLRFLRYFLNKLLGIIELTKSIEKPVQDFVSGCNRYLAASEPSTQLRDEVKHSYNTAFDGKALRMDPKDLSVDVESLPSLKPITLDALSSGEKQMISLFAKLYLYPGKKIVLIDEPELSLSIDWQRGILLDVVLAPLCEQVIAITHSPFIFDNALEPFARSMKLFIDREKQANLLDLAGSEGVAE